MQAYAAQKVSQMVRWGTPPYQLPPSDKGVPISDPSEWFRTTFSGAWVTDMSKHYFKLPSQQRLISLREVQKLLEGTESEIFRGTDLQERRIQWNKKWLTQRLTAKAWDRSMECYLTVPFALKLLPRWFYECVTLGEHHSDKAILSACQTSLSAVNLTSHDVVWCGIGMQHREAWAVSRIVQVAQHENCHSEKFPFILHLDKQYNGPG